MEIERSIEAAASESAKQRTGERSPEQSSYSGLEMVRLGTATELIRGGSRGNRYDIGSGYYTVTYE